MSETPKELLELAAAQCEVTGQKPRDIVGRVLRHPECALDWRTATDEELAAEAVRLGWSFSLLRQMGI